MRTILQTCLTAATLATIAGCSTASKMYDQNGQVALLVDCGAATSFSVCHERAMKECPNGYITISETPGFNRKELRIRCK